MIQPTTRQRPTQRSGQALVEYVMTMLLVIGIWTGINAVIKKNIKDMWKHMAQEIAAGCPGCTPPDSIR